jgi:outer membrane protein insertion porin family
MNELSPEIIINNEDNAFNLGLKLGFARKNFLGDARNFTLSSSAAAQNIVQFLQHPALNDTSILGYADARLGFEQPFLFGKPITTKLITYVTLQKRRDEYNASILGTKLTFNFELPKYTFLTSLTAYLNWERAKYLYQDTYIRQNLKISFVRELKSSSNKIDSLVNSFMKNIITDNYTTNNTIFGVDLNAVKTNSIVFPTKGYTLNLLLEDGNSIPYLISKIGGFRWSSPEYFKVLFTSTYYFPVYHENTSAFGIKFKVGNIFNYKGNKADIPLNQRFYSGGSNSVRGWRSRQLVPRNPVLDVTKPSEDFNAVLLRGISPGGYFLLEGSIETRNRLIGKIGSAVFIDYGNTWNKAKNFRFDQLAVAAGFGFRYYTQFVPLRIDFGFKIYDPFDKRSFVNRLKDHNGFWNVFQFHLGIGEAF